MAKLKEGVNKNAVVYILKNGRQIRIELATATPKQLKLLEDLKHPSIESSQKASEGKK